MLVLPPTATTGAHRRRWAARDESDAALVARLQQTAFGYLWQYCNSRNGLVADTSRAGSPCSIAVVGFALSAYLVAIERGWISRQAGAARTLATLRFLLHCDQSGAPQATGYKGFYFHFLDMQTGRRAWNCELSLIDSTLLLAGLVTSGLFFDRHDEAEIRDAASLLCERVDWRWAQGDSKSLSQGWLPEAGFLHYGWEGYNEALLLYVLGLGARTRPLPAAAFTTWTVTYQWERIFGQDVLYAGPLFTHLFPQAWLDLRGIRDDFMREKRSDYFQNTRRAIALQREYCECNPLEAAAYARDLWGISAGDGPTGAGLGPYAVDQYRFGYMARGLPFGPDDGTLCPWAMLASLPFDADAALTGTRRLLRDFPQVCPAERFVSGFNPSVDAAPAGWVSEGWYGLDQGLLVLSIENARSGLIWSLTRDSPAVRRGLRRAGFSGGWLGS